ncbi:MAG: ribosome biogenesis GTP-binding protein YihA/YsxC [Oscillospiraceae bacterium]|jgi:GTP-binding protein|nr:ribosome biogenesis GTP-binding protein YihA/YsxC [Oscillospiraceae bacterium]
MNLNNVEFIKSAATSRDLIDSSLPQIVFSGKSNVGKSSVINKLLNRKSFARVSSSPGKTIHVNYFLIDEKAYFVDLPGYGYAKVSKTEKNRWSALMEEFFYQPDHITLGVMIVDARHKPTADDVTMAHWFKESGCRLVVVANKIDKLKKSAVAQNIEIIRNTLGLREDMIIIEFSAQKGTNRNLLLAEIENVV